MNFVTSTVSTKWKISIFNIQYMKYNYLILCLISLISLSSCYNSKISPGPSPEQKEVWKKPSIKNSDRVNISYKLHNEANEIVDSSDNITLVVWSGSLPFIGLHEVLIGMQEGGKQILKLPASKLYGDERQNRIFREEQLLEISQKTIPIEDLQKYKTEFEGKKFIVINKTKINATIRLTNPSPLFLWDTLVIGQESDQAWNGGKMRVEKIEWEYITVSYPTGHPLSGKSLNLEVEIKKILK